MKNLLAFLGAALVVFVGVGLYLNWFHISRGPSAEGHKAFNIDVNTDKIKADAEKGGETVVGAIEKARREAEEKAKAEAEKKAEADRAANGDKTDGKMK